MEVVRIREKEGREWLGLERRGGNGIRRGGEMVMIREKRRERWLGLGKRREGSG